MATMAAPSAFMPGAEAFYYEATGSVACLLIHGFTGSAHELRDLGRHLANEGVPARGVLLAGHGTRPRDMASHTYHHWVSDVEAALDELQTAGKRVVLCGLSMGGTLTLNVAARRADDPNVVGIVALAAPLRLTDWRLRLVPVLGLLKRWHSWGRPDIKDATQWERHVAYRTFHVRALVQLLRLLRETRQLVSRVRQPLLVIHSRQDNTVPPWNAELIMQSVSSPHRRLVWLENCYHVVTLDYDSHLVRAAVRDFIREQADACVDNSF